MAVYDVQLVHVDKMLTNFATSYVNGEPLGLTLLPPINVQKQSDKYWKFGREEWRPEYNDVRAPGTEAHEIAGRTLSTDTYFAEEKALEIAVTDEELQNADSPLDARRDATLQVVGQLDMAQEIRMITLLETTGSYASGNSGAASYHWHDYTNSDPIADIRAAREVVFGKIHIEPNVLVIPRASYIALLDHPDILARIQYVASTANPDNVRMAMAQLFGVSRIVVPTQAYISSNEGATVTTAVGWDTDAILAYVNPNPSMRSQSFGYTFFWPYSDAGGARKPVERWYEVKRGAEVIRVRMRYDFKITNNEAAYLLTDIHG